MNNHTLFISDLSTLIFYAAGLGLLSLGNRQFIGLRWFFGTEALFAVKSVLQGLNGTIPRFFSYYAANTLVMGAFACLYLGFAYSAGPGPKRRWVTPAILALGASAYLALYLAVSPAAFVMASAPVLVFCAMTMALLLRAGLPEFRAVSRVSAALIALHAMVLIFRMAIITVHTQGMGAHGQAFYDRWFANSMLALMIIDAALVGCFVWFFVAALHQELHRLAATDPLTGALNRRAIEAEAEREIARAARNGAAMSVLVLDVDRFKMLNDSLGHDAGDAVLCGLVSLLGQQSRAADLIARSGGEEFLILLPETDLEPAFEVAKRLRRAVEDAWVEFEGMRVRYTISIGVAALGAEQPTWASLVRAADKALYEAKAAGRNRTITHGITPRHSTLQV